MSIDTGAEDRFPGLPRGAEPDVPELARLRRIAAVMCVLVAVIGAAAEIALAWVWLSPELVAELVAPRVGVPSAAAATDFASRLAGFLVSSVPLLALLYLLHQAYELFDGYRLGNVFTADAARRLRRIGLATLGLAVLRPLTLAGLSIVLTVSNASGQRLVVLGLSVEDLMLAAFGGMLFAIGHVMGLANALADDNRQIV